MSDRKVARRSIVKPFLKLVNYNHFMPTRYTFELADASVAKERCTLETLADAATKKAAKKELKKVLEEKYKSGQNKWFFQKLRF